MRINAWIWPWMASAAALAALIVGLVLVDRAGEAAIARQQAATAAAARDYFVAFAHEEGAQALATALNRRARISAQDGFRYALEDAQGRMIAGADVVSSLDAPDEGWRTVVEPDTRPRHLWRVLAQPLGGGLTLVVAEDLGARDALRRAVFQESALAVLITGLGAAAGGFGLNAMLLRRTRAIADTAARIADGDLSARAPVGGRRDLFDDLAADLNRMLARIEELMTGMRTVTDSIAHDLRSPLTRMKGALVRAADPAAPEPARLAALDEADAAADRVLATLNALLDIARAESGLSREMMQRLDLGALALEMAELFGPACEDAGQRLLCETPAEPILAWGHPASCVRRWAISCTTPRPTPGRTRPSIWSCATPMTGEPGSRSPTMGQACPPSTSAGFANVSSASRPPAAGRVPAWAWPWPRLAPSCTGAN